MLISIVINGIYYKYDIEMNELWRKDWYIRRFFSLADYAKEIRLTDVGENMLSEYDKNTELQRKAEMKVNLKAGAFDLLLGLSNMASNIFILLYMAYHQ